MNRYQSMMVTNGDFFDVKSPILQPVVDVSQSGRNPIHYLVERNAQILVRRPILSCPFPSLIEHPSMELAKVGLDERVFPSEHTRIERPSVRFKNVRAFKLVQLTLRREAWS